jgi:hypothetical protein
MTAPAGTDTDTDDTDTVLDLLKDRLGAAVREQIPASRPSESPPAVTAIWTRAEAGPCNRCRRECCRYGPLGRPLCADCAAAQHDHSKTAPPG